MAEEDQFQDQDQDPLLCAEDASNVVGSLEDEEEEVEEDRTVEHLRLSAQPEPSFDALPAMADEQICGLFEKETDFVPGDGYVQLYRNLVLDIDARNKAIAWILKVHGHYGFGPLTAYRAVSYLDRFLQQRPLEKGRAWMMQLLAVGSLSLAAKMEETHVPFLLDLQAEKPEFTFESRTVQRMELLILSSLQWRMLAVTPFSFLDYFLDRQGPQQEEGSSSSSGGRRSSVSRAMAARATELILATHRVIEFAAHRPSSMAAAALLCAADELLPPDAAVSWKESILLCKRLCREWVWRSYGLMQETLMAIGGGPCWSVPQSPVAVLDGFCVSSSTSSNNGSSVSPASLSMSVSSLYASVAAKRRKLNNLDAAADPATCVSFRNSAC